MAVCAALGLIPAVANSSAATPSSTIADGICTSSSWIAWSGKGIARTALEPMRVWRSALVRCLRLGSATINTATAPCACAFITFTRVVA